MKQGLTALALLAASPKTAHFISYLLAQRFVADQPPAGLVNRMAASYMASDGDIAAVLKTLAASPEFNSHRYFRNKVKTPTEFVASVLRSTGTEPQDMTALASEVRDMGMEFYHALPPTGYYLTADHWMNTQALVRRMNFSDRLTRNGVGRQTFSSANVLAQGIFTPEGAQSAMHDGGRLVTVAAHSGETPRENGVDVALRVLERTLIGAEVSARTNQVIHRQIAAQDDADPQKTLAALTALVMGSPEFQLR